MIRVKATREGEIGKLTASGWKIDTIYPYAALPSTKALGKWVRITNPLNNKTTYAQIRDVGPWNEHDDNYVFQPLTMGGTVDEVRPAAEAGEHVVYVNGTPEQHIDPTRVNMAGIDLGDAVYNALGMKDNGLVLWEFIG